MGSNLVLLESEEEGKMKTLLEEAADWIRGWFKDVRKWRSKDIDNERLTWVRCYGIPAHAWTSEFFKFIMVGTGDLLKVDANTERKKTMDVARVLIRTKTHDIINFVEKFDINGELFMIKVVEDWYGPLQWCARSEAKMEEIHSSDSEDEEEENSDSGGSSGDDLDDEGEEHETSGEIDVECTRETTDQNNHLPELNSIGQPHKKAVHAEEVGGLRINSNANKMMVNVEVCSGSSKGNLKQLNPRDGNNNSLSVTVGDGKNINKNSYSLNLPINSPNPSLDHSFTPQHLSNEHNPNPSKEIIPSTPVTTTQNTPLLLAARPLLPHAKT